MTIKVGSDFSGVGAFEQALKRLGIEFETMFACDMDKYARKTYIANYGEPAYYPENVYDREIPAESLDIYMTSPPCQAFSIAGKRLGKDDERGILFFNSHEFIRVNKPRFFIFENVKGLLSDDKTSKDDTYGRTFREWINYLGGKSVNGVPVLFPHDEAVPYHIYHTVINAKDHNIPQNRERVFIVGIRDDSDNVFSWPQEQPLTKRLRDVLEENVDSKYYLSEKMVKWLLQHTENSKDKGNGFKFELKNSNSIANTINTRIAKMGVDDNYVEANTGAGHNDYVVKVKSATKQGYELAKDGDSVNIEQPSSETRRGRVGHQIAQTLNTSCLQGVIQLNQSTEFHGGTKQKDRFYDPSGISPTLITSNSQNSQKSPKIIVQKTNRKFPYIFRQTCGCGHKFIGSLSRICPSCNSINSGWTNELRIKRKRKEVCILVLTPDRLEKRQNGRRFKEDGEPFFTLTAQDKHGIYNGITIRRLTPTECFRLMGFPDTLVQNARTAGISDSQLYKQAGNSIVVDVLANIIKGLKKL